MEATLIIAENLKRLRTERNLSLGQLATLSGVSKVMLSQIEKAETNPTVNTVWKIAAGLKAPYSALLEQRKQDAVVIGRGGISAQEADGGHYRLYCYYPGGPQRNFEMFQVELDAGTSHTTSGHTEKTVEYIMVLEGELKLTVNDREYVLRRDEAVEFAAGSPQTYFSCGDGTLKAIILNYYPY